MSRREQLAAVRSAEAALVARHGILHGSAQARMDALRRVHPALLLGAAAFAGAFTQRLAARRVRSGPSLSRGLQLGVRLLRLVPGGAIATVLGQDA